MKRSYYTREFDLVLSVFLYTKEPTISNHSEATAKFIFAETAGMQKQETAGLKPALSQDTNTHQWTCCYVPLPSFRMGDFRTISGRRGHKEKCNCSTSKHIFWGLRSVFPKFVPPCTKVCECRRWIVWGLLNVCLVLFLLLA